MKSAYIFALIISILGLMVLDKKYRLALFWNRNLIVATVLIGVMFFLAWDIVGIVLGVFSTNQNWVTGVYVVTPDLPIEEFLFLILLNYQIVLLWRWRCLPTS